MKSLKLYQAGLAAVEELSLEDWEHEELVAMVAGRLLKLKEEEWENGGEHFGTHEEEREDCERAARICCSLAFAPQGLSPADVFSK